MNRLRTIIAKCRTKEYLCVSLVLLILLCGYFWKLAFLGHCFTAADILFMVDPWKTYKPPGLDAPQNKLHGDEVTAFYPWRTLTVEMVRKGQVPLWNPYVLLGAPHLANYQTTIFDPLNAISYVLPLKMALNVTAVLKLFLCGLAAYGFARTIGIGRGPATFCAVTYAFCGYNISWLKWPLVSAMVWLPVILICVEKIISSKRTGWTLLLSIVIGMLFFSGHPESIFTILVGVALYTVIRAAQSAWHERKPVDGVNTALCVAAATCIGACIAAVQLIPFAEFLRNSWTVYDRAKQSGAVSGCVFPMLLSFFVPWFFGDSAHRNYWGFRNSNIDASLYNGIAALMLAAVAVVMLRRANAKAKGPAVALAVTSLLCTAFAFEMYGFSWVVGLPMFDQLRFEYFVAFNCIAIPTLGAMGLELFSTSERRDRRNGLIGVVLLFVLALSLYVSQFQSGKGIIKTLHMEQYEVLQIGKFLAWSIGTVLLLTLFHVRRFSAWILSAGFACITIADLFSFGIWYNPTLDSRYVFPDTRLFQRLREDRSLYRVTCTASAIPSSTLMVYRIPDEWGYDGIYYYRSVAFPSRLKTLIWKKFSGLLNIKYFLRSPFMGEGMDFDEQSRYRLVTTLENVTIYENLRFLPRAFVVHRAVVARTENEVFELLASDNFDPATTVALERKVPETVSAQLERAPLKDGSTAVVTQYEPTNVAVEVIMEHPGFLILSDTYYPGWKVFVDGKPDQLYAANYIVRAVFVPEGTHRVEFRYDPMSFRAGAWLSICALGLVAVIACVSQFRARRLSSVSAELTKSLLLQHD